MEHGTGTRTENRKQQTESPSCHVIEFSAFMSGPATQWIFLEGRDFGTIFRAGPGRE